MAYCNPLIESNYRDKERERERGRERRIEKIKEEGGGDTKRQWSKEKGTRKQSHM